MLGSMEHVHTVYLPTAFQINHFGLTCFFLWRLHVECFFFPMHTYWYHSKKKNIQVFGLNLNSLDFCVFWYPAEAFWMAFVLNRICLIWLICQILLYSVFLCLLSLQDLNDSRENIPIVRFCAVSALESSHKAPVTDVQWLPPTFEVQKSSTLKN